jgi:hypothetical protein
MVAECGLTAKFQDESDPGYLLAKFDSAILAAHNEHSLTNIAFSNLLFLRQLRQFNFRFRNQNFVADTNHPGNLVTSCRMRSTHQPLVVSP